MKVLTKLFLVFVSGEFSLHIFPFKISKLMKKFSTWLRYDLAVYSSVFQHRFIPYIRFKLKLKGRAGEECLCKKYISYALCDDLGKRPFSRNRSVARNKLSSLVLHWKSDEVLFKISNEEIARQFRDIVRKFRECVSISPRRRGFWNARSCVLKLGSRPQTWLGGCISSYVRPFTSEHKHTCNSCI